MIDCFMNQSVSLIAAPMLDTAQASGKDVRDRGHTDRVGVQGEMSIGGWPGKHKSGGLMRRTVSGAEAVS